MQKIKTFFYTFKNSLISPDYYSDIYKAPFSFSIKYLLALIMVPAIVASITIAVVTAQLDPKEITNDVSSVFPQDLVITGDSDGVSINQSLPFFVDIPLDYSDANSPQHLVAFTSDEATRDIEDVLGLDSLIVVTESKVYSIENFDTQALRIDPIPAFTETLILDRSIVDNLVDEFLDHPFIKNKLYVPFLAIFVGGATCIILGISYGLLLLFYALVTQVLSSILLKNKKINYKKALQLSIHGLTLVVVTKFLFGLFGFAWISSWYFFAIFAIWMSVVLNKFGDKKTTS